MGVEGSGESGDMSFEGCRDTMSCPRLLPTLSPQYHPGPLGEGTKEILLGETFGLTHLAPSRASVMLPSLHHLLG